MGEVYLSSNLAQSCHRVSCNMQHYASSGDCGYMTDEEMQELTSAWDTLSDEALNSFEEGLDT